MAVNLARSNDEGNGSEWIQGMTEGLLDCDLNKLYIQRPAATFRCPAPNPGIEGINQGDNILIDRSITPVPGHVVLVELDGAYAIKRLLKEQERFCLVDDYGFEPPRRMMELDTIAGVVVISIHEHARK